MANEYNIGIANVVREYLESQEWHFGWDEEKGLFTLGMNIHCKLKNCKIYIHIYKDAILVRALSPVYADIDEPDIMNRTARYLHMANYGLRNGNFELDMTDGEVAYKTYAYFGDDLPTVKVIERYVDVTYFMMRDYGNGLTSVIFAGADPAAAIRQAESGDEEEEEEIQMPLLGEIDPSMLS
ncbi:MAG: YbjN domain-containing protein [Oscillospiraceae bacterium]|jgi:hypothetical protein|nr:YbjN domain-containing protein [Oscillospiraceae bacterium]